MYVQCEVDHGAVSGGLLSIVETIRNRLDLTNPPDLDFVILEEDIGLE